MVNYELKMKIHEESDLFSPLDPDQNVISEEVVDYWERIFIHKHMRIKEDYFLHIITDTPVNEENVKQKIKNHFIQEKKDIEYAIRRVTIRVIIFGLIGAAFLAFWFISSANESVNTEILCIIGWVGIGKAAEIYLMERAELFRTRFQIKKLIDSKVIITESND